MRIEQPEKYCQRCGELIPSNEDLLSAWNDAYQRAARDGGKMPPKPKSLHSGLLACEACAIAASGEVKAVKRKGNPVGIRPVQERIEAPLIFVS